MILIKNQKSNLPPFARLKMSSALLSAVIKVDRQDTVPLLERQPRPPSCCYSQLSTSHYSSSSSLAKALTWQHKSWLFLGVPQCDSWGSTTHTSILLEVSSWVQTLYWTQDWLLADWLHLLKAASLEQPGTLPFSDNRHLDPLLLCYFRPKKRKPSPMLFHKHQN